MVRQGDYGKLVRTCCRLLVTIGFIVCIVEGFNLEPSIPVIKVGDPDTYFGYSVAQHIEFNPRRRDPESHILVGAPRAESGQSGTNRTGAIYECPISTLQRDCKRITIDDTGPVLDDESKDDQWLGVTVKSQGPGGYVMACAHRYVKQGPSYRWGNGICYSLTQNLDYDNVFDPCENRPVHKAHEQFGYCQAGTSGTITEDNNIVIGTPGPYTWRGTVFINTIAHGMFDDFTWYYGPLFDHSAPVDKYSYLGMSVTSGRFFRNETSFVAGAPRANNTGQVVFFRRIPGNDILKIQAVLNGELFASSFGYEIATADLNGDRLPDLIVGAPFYYDKNAGGAIYVYLNSRDKGISRDTVPTRITGQPDSRFGIAITNCSDLNKDGFEDIAVGAPYEGNGVVYIYLGSKTGIQTEPVQVIKSEDLPQLVRTFGHSLSGGLDLDANKYPDLIVGAYEDDSVVLLRARPIISIVTTVDTGNDLTISPTTKTCSEDPRWNDTCFSFRTCFQITSKEALKTSVVTINYTIVAETFLGKKISRVTIRDGSDITKPRVNRLFTLRDQELLRLKCQREIIYLRKFSDYRHIDILTPVSFKVTYSLVQEKPRIISGATLPRINDYPILNQQEASKVFHIPFEKDCGEDDVCESELDTKAFLYPPGGVLSLGEMPNITLEVLIRNKHESAYEAAVYVTHPESLIFSRGRVENSQHYCRRFDKITVVCNLDNPFRQQLESTVIRIEFSTNKVKDSESALYFSVKANSTSKERRPKPPVPLTYEVKRKAELSYKGISEPEQVKYGGEIRGQSAMEKEEDVGSLIEHRHTLENKGPWHISSLTMTFHWPIEMKDETLPRGKRLLYLLEPPTISQTYGTCTIKDEDINSLDLMLMKVPVQPTKPVIGSDEFDKVTDKMTTDELETTERSEHRQNQSYYEESYTVTRTKTRTSTRVKSTETTRTETRSKRDTEAVEAASLTKKKTFVFECNTTARCLRFQCNIQNLRAGKNVVIRMRARLWNSTLVSEFPTVDSVQIITAVDINVDPVTKIDLINDFSTRQIIKTSCFPDIPYSHLKKEIPYWVYILAACIGILLLVMIIVCLWKVGFFKRKTPNEMMKGKVEKNPYEH